MTKTGHANDIFKPEFRFGMGGVSLGNEFNKISDKEAEAALETAWNVGVRYFDGAPWYGLGLAERRFGHFLQSEALRLSSSKVGTRHRPHHLGAQPTMGRDWWPNHIGSPSATGSQNDMRYAFFPTSRRLALSIGGKITVYDTKDHLISGFSQQQPPDQSVTFNS